MSYYECPKCGAQTDIDKSVLTRCPVCGDPVPEDKREAMREHIKLMKEVDEILSEPDSGLSKVLEDGETDDATLNEYGFCPRCMSQNISIGEKGFNTNRTVWAYIFGVKDPWVFGILDMRNKVCKCRNCGKEFKPENALRASLANAKKTKDYVNETIGRVKDKYLEKRIVENEWIKGDIKEYIAHIRQKKHLPAEKMEIGCWVKGIATILIIAGVIWMGVSVSSNSNNSVAYVIVFTGVFAFCMGKLIEKLWKD